MPLSEFAKPTTCDIHRPFGAAVTTAGVRCRLTEQIDEGRPPGTLQNTPSVHVTGQVSAPVANTVIADTGALGAGLYEILVNAGSDDVALRGRYMLIERRNAANTATLHRKLVPIPHSDQLFWPRVTIVANERVRVVSGTVDAAASTVYTADIYLRPASDLFWTHYIDLDSDVDIRDGVTRITGANAITYADGDEVRIPDANGDRYVVVLVVLMGFGRELKYKRAYLLRHIANWTGSGQT